MVESEWEARERELVALVMALAEKLATCAEHLGRLSERKDVRRG